MFGNIRKRQAPKKHLYVERPAYIITETELGELEAELSRLREERDALYEANWPWEWIIATREKKQRQAAEARCARLQQALTEANERYGLKYEECARLQQALADAKDARRGVISACIAVKGKLDQPYRDDNRWTPWQRFIEPALRRLDEALADKRPPSDPVKRKT